MSPFLKRNNAIFDFLLMTGKVTESEEVDKGTKKLDNNKKAVVTKPLSKKQVLTTEKVKTSE